MKSHERTRALIQSPKLLWQALGQGRYDFVYDQIPLGMAGMSLKKRLNLVKAGMNLIHRRPLAWSMPLHMQVELTNFCNLRCPVCPCGIKEIRRKPQSLDTELFRRVMDEVGPYLLTTSLWAWGEPLLHPDLHGILSVVHPHKMATLLSTNGQNLDHPRVVDALTRFPPTHLIVAVDGLTDETHSKFRVGAKLAPIFKGIKEIARIKAKRRLTHPILHMRFIVMNHNQHQLGEVTEFARDHGFEFVSIRTLSIIDDEGGNRSHQELIPTMSEFQAYGNKGKPRNGYICQEPFWFPSLFADGTLVPCEQDYNASKALGKIDRSTGFRKLWYGEAATRIRKQIRDQWQEISFCRNCPYRDRETSDCSVQAHVLSPGIQPGHTIK